MISSPRTGAAGTVRLLLLTVLLGLFGMHVLSAHGGDHHGVATVTPTSAGHGSAGHPGTSAAGTEQDSRAGDHPDSTASGEDVAVGSTSAEDSAAPGGSAVAVPGAPTDGAGLLACWLLITAGVALIALLLRSRSVHGSGFQAPLSIGGARPGRPRAPPGRLRLHELTVLRV